MYSLNKNANTWVLYLSKDTWIKMQIHGFSICQRPGFITWVYPSEFLPKNHVIYPGKSDFQTCAPDHIGHHNALEPQLGWFFKNKNANTQIQAVLSKKNPLMPGPCWYMKIKYPPTQQVEPTTCGLPMGEAYNEMTTHDHPSCMVQRLVLGHSGPIIQWTCCFITCGS